MENFPRLTISSGAYMAMKYLENGYVTSPQNQPGKLSGGGTASIFGTNSAKIGSMEYVMGLYKANFSSVCLPTLLRQFFSITKIF